MALHHGGVRAKTEVDLLGKHLQVDAQEAYRGNNVRDSVYSDKVSPKRWSSPL